MADPQAEVSPPPEPQPAPVATEAVSFDPSQHTVVEVKAHLARHPEDRSRIMRAERRGKARKSILDY
jgi:hypothetical protein